VLLSSGTRVPADCLIIESADLQVTQKIDETDHLVSKVSAPKDAQEIESFGEQDCFLHADTMVQRGTCKAVVCKVGCHDEATQFDTDIDTPLQQKLKNLTTAFTIYAIYTALIICVLLIIMMSIQASTLDTSPGS